MTPPAPLASAPVTRVSVVPEPPVSSFGTDKNLPCRPRKRTRMRVPWLTPPPLTPDPGAKYPDSSEDGPGENGVNVGRPNGLNALEINSVRTTSRESGLAPSTTEVLRPGMATPTMRFELLIGMVTEVDIETSAAICATGTPSVRKKRRESRGILARMLLTRSVVVVGKQSLEPQSAGGLSRSLGAPGTGRYPAHCKVLGPTKRPN